MLALSRTCWHVYLIGFVASTVQVTRSSYTNDEQHMFAVNRLLFAIEAMWSGLLKTPLRFNTFAIQFCHLNGLIWLVKIIFIWDCSYRQQSSPKKKIHSLPFLVNYGIQKWWIEEPSLLCPIFRWKCHFAIQIWRNMMSRCSSTILKVINIYDE